MRNFIDIVGAVLDEQFVSGFEIDRISKRIPIEVFKNPSRAEYNDCEQYDAVRAMIVDSDLYIWSFSALHAEVAEHMHFPKTCIPVILHGDYKGDVQVSVTDFSERTIWHHNGDVADEIRSVLTDFGFKEINVEYYDYAIVGDWSEADYEEEEEEEEDINEARNPKEIKQFRDDYNNRYIKSDTHGESARTNSRWKSSLSSMMRRHGFTILGAGINGAVYENPNYQYVIKVYRKDVGYDDWIQFALTNKHNSYVPKVRGKPIRLNDVFTAVRLEKLHEVDPVAANETISQIESIWSWRLHDGDSWKKFNRQGVSEAFPEIDLDIVDIAIYLYDWEGHTDLTVHNMMQRPNGELVIIDPLYIMPPEDYQLEEGILEAFYHGSQEESPMFIIGHEGNVSTAFGNYKSSRYGVFLSDNPRFAQQYGRVGKYTVDSQYIRDENGLRSDIDEFVETLDPFDKDERHIWLCARNVQTGSWPLWQMFDGDLGKAFYEFVKDEVDGYNFHEDHEDENEPNGSLESKTTVVLNPSVIRKIK